MTQNSKTFFMTVAHCTSHSFYSLSFAPCTQCFSVSLVFGIPTIKREKTSYLLDTLASLLDGMSQGDKDDSCIVIFVGEVNSLVCTSGWFCITHTHSIFLTK